MKVLIAENNENTLMYLGQILEKEGFDVFKAENGVKALQLYQDENPDFVCLDIMMPDKDGYEICKEIRQKDTKTPVVFISAKIDPVDKVAGLELGADDYITKPFDISEVIARIRAVARRCISESNSEDVTGSFVLADLQVFPGQLRAQRGGQIIDLSLRDVKILKLLYTKKNEVVDRDTMLDHCWGAHIMPESRTLDWHISQLRKRIEPDPKNPEIIKTVHGVGYKYEG